MTDPLIDDLAANLFLRIGEGIIVPGARRDGHDDDWQPAENECHTNVATWVAHRPETKHVRGFLFFDLECLMPFVWFNAHSVLELEDGRLADITPSRASKRYPFIRHTGSDAQWAAAERIGRITYYWR